MAKTKGIDISTWQSNVNFAKVKAAGNDFVIIRAGYGRDVDQKDARFEEHYKGAKAAGLKVGAYWYSYAIDVADAVREAKACLSCIKGKSFEFPVFFDMEESSQTRLGRATLTAMARAFCDTIIAGGYTSGVYSNPNWFRNYLNYEELRKSYPIWLAQYSDKAMYDCDIWQYSSTGRVNGVSGNCDVNYCYKDFGKVEKAEPKKNEPVDVTYRVRCGGKWLSPVKNLTDYAGIEGQPITDVAIKVSKGTIKYRVHILGSGWLPYVTGYNTKDYNNGFAGVGRPIDAIEIIYGGTKKARYRVSPIGASGYYSYQTDNDRSGDMDGYAGAIGVKFDKLQISIK